MRKRIVSIFFMMTVLSIFSCGPTGGQGGGTTTKDEETINIVAFNDFHGAIYPESGRIGLARLGTYIKEQGEKENTLVISQGDDWQGSIYSNYNHGQLINDVYAYARVDARTVGNHDFDWGIEKIVANTAREYDGYVTPVLAANVYDYDFASHTVGNTQQSNIGRKSVIYTLENGLKVGIVGVIGENQITSITSYYTETICFKNHIDIIKQEATELRRNGCDLVIASVHTGQDDVKNNSLGEYVDLVLCGHTHRYEQSSEGRLTYVQFGAYGELIGNIKLTYDRQSKKVTNTTVEVIDSNSINSRITSIDTNIEALINEYSSDCEEAANEVVASNVTSYFAQSETAVNLMCKAIYDEAVSEGYDDIILSYCNTARHYLPYGKWDYSDLYESFPFDNFAFVAEVSGRDIYYEVTNYNNVYFNPSFDKRIDPNKKYKIATIDFLLFHTNVRRYYDYFSSFSGTPIGVLNDNYRVILKNWLKTNGYKDGLALNPNDFSSSLPQHNRNSLIEI